MKSLDIRDVVDRLNSVASASFPGGIFYGWTRKDHKAGIFAVLNKVSDEADETERVVRLEVRICLPDENGTPVQLDASEKAVEDALAFTGKRSYGNVTAYKCYASWSFVTREDEKGRPTRVRDFFIHCLS